MKLSSTPTCCGQRLSSMHCSTGELTYGVESARHSSNVLEYPLSVRYHLIDHTLAKLAGSSALRSWATYRCGKHSSRAHPLAQTADSGAVDRRSYIQQPQDLLNGTIQAHGSYVAHLTDALTASGADAWRGFGNVDSAFPYDLSYGSDNRTAANRTEVAALLATSIVAAVNRRLVMVSCDYGPQSLTLWESFPD